MTDLDWTQDPEAQHTHIVRDLPANEPYYCTAPADWTLQDVADAFLDGYGAGFDYSEHPAVTFSVDKVGDLHAALFEGQPNGTARKTDELLRPY